MTPSFSISNKCEHFWFWYIAKAYYTRNSTEPADSPSGWNLGYSNLTALTCFPGYSIRSLDLRLGINNYSQITDIRFAQGSSNISSILADYELGDFGSNIYGQLGDDSLFFSNTSSILFLDDPGLTETDLLDEKVFNGAIVRMFKGFAAQVVHQNLRTNSTRRITGKTEYLSSRL
jgi:hypothetical protein